AFGPTRAMTQFFDLYERWLAAGGMTHSRDAFRRWAVHEYCPGRCRGSLEWLDARSSSLAGLNETGRGSPKPRLYAPRSASQRPATEIRVVAGEPVALRARARNLSPEVWRLLPGTGTGVHVRFMVFDELLNVVQVERAGLFNAAVAPGASVDLTLAVAPLRHSGTYRLVADILDGQQFSFSQYGMEPLTLDLHVTSHE